ncbi:hypothetical protein EGR_02026 [Echinococcus granulosus]|uniref:Uncharacterized protein n=1 Tax=Echinococcus granulosus TaxID=6210 RepID=W6UXE2_ECHGR|nr:hypothetical protein EGR_02026 [Echinococcus granulosus]EUB63222.1 hypothetical protein EGR_02026 [Echinococcus granulosus]
MPYEQIRLRVWKKPFVIKDILVPYTLILIRNKQEKSEALPIPVHDVEAKEIMNDRKILHFAFIFLILTFGFVSKVSLSCSTLFYKLFLKCLRLFLFCCTYGGITSKPLHDINTFKAALPESILFQH